MLGTTAEVAMRPFTVAVGLMAASLASGCAARYSYAPELVYAEPGVQVIADFDEPIFYVDNYYWRFDGGVWYRSSRYTGGWAYMQPPPAIVRIERPQAYVHYRPTGWVARRAPATVREQPRAVPQQRAVPPPPPRTVPQQQQAVAPPPPRAAPQQQAVPPPPSRAAPQQQAVAPPPPRAVPPPRRGPPPPAGP
jgi:hypothetical protein